MRDARLQLEKLEVAAIGVSPDTPRKQKNFDVKYTLEFPLLSDPEHQMAEAYGVWREKKMYGRTYMGIVRSAFLVAADGRLQAVWYKISPQNTVSELMKVISD